MHDDAEAPIPCRPAGAVVFNVARGHMLSLGVLSGNRQPGSSRIDSIFRAPKLSFAVNVPADMVGREDLPDIVENALRLWGSPGVELVLEITERSLIADPKRSFAILSRVRDLGVRISIDDFGTGYSCLAYFKDIPADELKIDRSFVQAMATDAASADIAALIIDLAHRFGLSVVAEGVEDQATFELLRQRNCDAVQGHLFAKTMRLDGFTQWLHQGHAAHGVQLGR